MNNIFYEMIFKRKSFHIFRNVGNESISKDELNDIQSAYSEFTPLNPDIKTAIRIIPEKEANCRRGGEYWTDSSPSAPHRTVAPSIYW